MSKVLLGDVAHEHKETCKGSKDGYPIVGLEHLIPEEITLTTWDEGSENTFTKMFRKGNVLFGRRRAYLKKAVVAPFDGICSGDITVIEADPDKTLPDLLPFIIQNDDLFDFAVEKSAGSLSPRVKWEHLKNYEFELPDMDKQKELAELLWAIDDTKKSYQELIAATDELVKSQFIEMFGGVEEKLFLKDCCTLHARVGWQALKKDEHQETGDYMLITGTDFRNGKVDYSTCVYVSKERYDMDPYIQVQDGDILITKDGTIGKVAIVEGLPKPATLNAGVFVVRPDGRFNVGYFSYLFKGPIFADFVEASKTGSTIKHLNQAKLLKYEIPAAQPDKQEEFASIYAQSDKSKLLLQNRYEIMNQVDRRLLTCLMKTTRLSR